MLESFLIKNGPLRKIIGDKNNDEKSLVSKRIEIMMGRDEETCSRMSEMKKGNGSSDRHI